MVKTQVILNSHKEKVRILPLAFEYVFTILWKTGLNTLNPYYIHMKNKEQKKERPEITVTRENDEGIIQFGTRKLVKKMSTGAGIYLPKELIGKYVDIYYFKQKKEVRKKWED